MRKGDISIRQWLKDKKRFADLFNGFIFGGEQIVRPEELVECDSESDIIVTDKYKKEKGVQRYRDVVMRWTQGLDLMILACENQQNIHYAMPVRTMLYDSLSYMEQIRALWRERAKQEDAEELTEEEFLSRFRKDDKLCPVVTIVFYYGTESWDMNRELYEMFHIQLNQNVRDSLEKCIPNYRLNLLDAERLEDLERFKSDLQIIFRMIQYRSEKDKLKEYMNEHREYFARLDDSTYQACKEFLGVHKMLDQVVVKKEGGVDMCKALEDLYADGVAEGEVRGEALGKATFVRNMLNRDMDIADICALAECTPEFVEEVRQSMISE